MAVSKQTHRHLVALPLAAALLVLIGLSNAVFPVSASALGAAKRSLTVSAAAEMKEMDLPSGLHLSLEAGAAATVTPDGASLVTGKALANAEGFATITLPCLTVTFLHSAAYVSLSDSSANVAAIDGPVLLASCHERRVLLAEGEQAHLQGEEFSVAAVPDAWLQDVRFRLLSLAPSPSAPDVFSDAFIKNATVADVRTALAAANEKTEGVPALFALRLLPDLLRFNAETIAAVNGALFASDALRPHVVRAVPRVVHTEMLALDPSTVQAWRNAAAITASVDGSALLATLGVVATLPSVLEDAGYPKQSRLWMQALQETATVLRPLVGESERTELDTLVTKAFDHASQVQIVTDEVLKAKQAPALTGNQIITKTEQLLDAAEVLRTAATTVTSDAQSQTARVEQIYLSEDGRDTPYDFTYTPETDMVSGVVRDGVKLPNKMKAFVMFPLLRKEAR